VLESKSSVPKSEDLDSSPVPNLKIWTPAQCFGSVALSERIRDYPEDKPYPSALFLGWHEGTPLHVVAAVDEINETVYIITAYQPSLDYFETDYKTRKNQ